MIAMSSKIAIYLFASLIPAIGSVAQKESRDTATIEQPDRLTADRIRMISTQIQNRSITDKRLIAAMTKVERHLFVPQAYRHLAYSDQPLPIAEGQTISQPYIVALMTDLLELDSTDRVLEVGTGSGYQAAILGELAAQVFSIEIIKPLADSAAALLKKLQYTNITVRQGDGYAGWPDEAPFDAIIVTCAPPYIPEPLINQLAEGGILVLPVGSDIQLLKVLRKIDGVIKDTSIAPVRFVPMTGEGIKKQ